MSELEQKRITVPFQDIDLKKEGDEQGIFLGYGSTFGGKPDSYGDIVDKGAFEKTLSEGGRNGFGVAMLWSHDSDRPVGKWLELSENSVGLKAKGKLTTKATDGSDMFELMKDEAVQGLSIGFTISKYEIEKVDETEEGGYSKIIRHLKEVKLWEISPVVFPANTRATITNVKDAIENSSNEKELEAGLREAGLSNSASKYITSLIKDKFFRREAENESSLKEILSKLKSVNSELELTKNI